MWENLGRGYRGPEGWQGEHPRVNYRRSNSPYYIIGEGVIRKITGLSSVTLATLFDISCGTVALAVRVNSEN